MLKCDVCGHAIVIQPDKMAKCEYCGVLYSLEALQKKLQISRADDLVNPDKEKLLRDAKTFIELGKPDEAKKRYKELAQKYPDDYRGWWGSLTACSLYGIKDFISDSVKTALQLKPTLEDEYRRILSEAIQQGKIEVIQLDNMRDVFVKEDFPELFINAIDAIVLDAVKRGNLFFGNVDLWYIKDVPAQSQLRIAYEQGLPYVKRFNAMMGNNYGKTVDKIWSQMGFSSWEMNYECFCVLGDTVGIRERGADAIYSTIHLPVPVEAALQELEKVYSTSWHRGGKCVECGGKITFGFLGLNGAHCESCGAKYEYYDGLYKRDSLK